MDPLTLLVSLHDVTPFHLPRLLKAERWFVELGVRRVAYLLVPRFHGGFDAGSDARFVSWCRSARPFEVEWLLHGFEHREPRDGATPAARVDRLRRRWLTGGEGEFLALGPEETVRRLSDASAEFRRCLDRDPDGFVAPAWLSAPPLLDDLRSAGFRYTEDHRRLYDLRERRAIACPVVTWATRTFARRVGARAVNPLLAHRWRHRPWLRVAVHPYDFDHPETVQSIAAVLRRALAARREGLPSDLFDRTGARPVHGSPAP